MSDEASSPLLSSADPHLASPSSGASNAAAAVAVVVVTPMELPGSARPTFFVHPLLFYRHCFRLTSQNDRVPRVLVMSEHYVTYLCAPDGRATWSFHPTTVRMVRILPSKDQTLFSFVHHTTDLLLHFDEKLSSDRVNPRNATLSYFLYLLRRENPAIEVTEEEDHRCLAQSKLVKAKNQSGAEGFVRRLVDGLRGYYLVLKAQVDEVREQMSMQSDRHATQSLSSLAGTLLRSRRPTVTARQAPLKLRPVSSISSPRGAPRIVAPRDGASRFVALALPTAADEENLNLPAALRAAGAEDNDGAPPLILFFRRNVAVTIGFANVLTTPSFLDRVGVLGDSGHPSGGAASLPAASSSLPLLHPSTRTGDLFVDAFGVAYFVPSAGSPTPRATPAPQTDADAPQRVDGPSCEVVMLLGRVVDAVIKPHRWLCSGGTDQETPSRGTARGGEPRRRAVTVAEVASKYNRFTLGSVVAAMTVPLPTRTTASKHHSGSEDGGECPMRSPMEAARVDDDVACRPDDAQSILQRYYEASRSREQQTSSSAWCRTDDDDDDPDDGDPLVHVSSALGLSPLDRRAATYAETQRARTTALRRAHRRANATSQRATTTATIVTVVDLDAFSASRMAATDGDVSSLEVFAKLLETFRRRPVNSMRGGDYNDGQATTRCDVGVGISSNVEAAQDRIPPDAAAAQHHHNDDAAVSTKVLLTGKDVKRQEKAMRAERRKAAADAQQLEASVARLKDVDAFAAAKHSLEMVADEFGMPWGRLTHQQRGPMPERRGVGGLTPPVVDWSRDGVAIGRSRAHVDAALSKLVQLVCARSEGYLQQQQQSNPW